MESLLETHVRTRRRWTTLLSFFAQILVIAALVLSPLFYTQALPTFLATGPLIGPPPGQSPRAADERRVTRAQSTSELVGTTVRLPVHIPDRITEIADEQPSAPPLGDGIAVPGGTGERGRSTLLEHVLTPLAATPSPPPPARVSLPSRVSQAFLIQQVKPEYPPLARTAGIQGTVVLSAIISRSGQIEGLRVLSGHPLLVPAAIDAVQRWRYRPYLLNGQPYEVETQITINFTLVR
ncbi:MAG: energy transducer TonB [Terriglobales bacterium]